MSAKATMQSMENCGVCGKPLVYGTEEVALTCVFCGREFKSLIYCPDGHFVCDECHSCGALDIIREIMHSTKSANASEILEKILSHPSVPMHGPEHHAIVPAVIIAALRNAGYAVPEDAIDKALSRGSKVPGGWCGSHGVCGAAIGVGIAVSVLTKATPLTGETRALANEATMYTLNRLIDGQPRCCKRASRMALDAAVDFLRERMGIKLEKGETVACNCPERNKECIREKCRYYKPE
jgi:hypothetical protein